MMRGSRILDEDASGSTAGSMPSSTMARQRAVVERGARFRGVIDMDDAALLKREPEIVALARPLADAGEHGHTAVLRRDVVNKLLDDDGLADAGAAEEANLAAAQVRLKQIDN